MEGIVRYNAVAGHVRVFLWYENAWAQIGNDIDGEGALIFLVSPSRSVLRRMRWPWALIGIMEMAPVQVMYVCGLRLNS